jgi:hypothetical protein
VCDCGGCREAQNDASRARRRARAQKRLPVEVRQRLQDAIYAGQPFKMVLRDLGLTSNQVWGFTKTDQEWSERLDAALTAARRDDLQTRYECRIRARLRLPGVPRAPASPDGSESATAERHPIVLRRTRG